jgi:superfamily II DNA or RNA helicase
MDMSGFLFDLGRDEKPVIKDRDYQTEGINAVWQHLFEYEEDACQLLAATGLGKTNMAVGLIKRYLAEFPWKGVIFCTPRIELVQQTAERLKSLGVDCEIEMGADRSDHRVTVACYQSLMSRKRYERFLKSTGLFINDEVHLNFTSKSRGMVDMFRQGQCKIVGMTATPKKDRSGAISQTYGSPAFVMDYFKGVNKGWLVPAKSYLCINEHLDLSAWRESWVGKGDDSKEFDSEGRPISCHAVAKMMARKEVVSSICGMIAEYYDAQSSVVFAMSIAQAEEICTELNARDIPASVVHSKMSKPERRLHLNDYEEGRSSVIVNVGCLTLGWDSPRTSKLFIARPTKQTTLLVQMLGRGTRMLPGTIDGCTTIKERKKAIAKSDKPFMEVFDITDSTRSVDLKTSMDVCQESNDPRLMKRVRGRLLKGPVNTAISVDSVLAEEARALAAEDKAHEEYEYNRRQGIHGKGDYAAYERSIRADAEVGRGEKVLDRWYMPYGKYKGKKFSKIPNGALHWHFQNPKTPPDIKRNIGKYLHKQSY